MKKYSLLFLLFFLLKVSLAQPPKNLTLLSSLQFPGQTLSGCWHYNDSTGKEYALIGGSLGVIIVDITDPVNPHQLFQLPGVNSIWHEIKVAGNFAYAVSQGQDTNNALNGMQIIDLRFLPDSAPNIFYRGDSIIANQLLTVHSITAAEHFVYLNGHNITALGRGVIILDVSDPLNPKYTGAITNRYCHDSYVRSNIIYTSDINNGLFSVYNISNPSNPILLATQSTPTTFNHNTWLSDDGNTIYTTDERHNAPLASYDISDLNNITFLDTIYNRNFSDYEVHNVRVKNDFLITPSYGSQLTLIDALHPSNLIEIGNYTTGSSLCWDADPFTNSGNVIATDMNAGTFFLFSANYIRACYLDGIVSDSLTGLPIIGANVVILPTSAAVSSDISGNYQTGFADSGTYTIEISKPNYFTRQITVTLHNGITTNLNVKLLSLSAGMSSVTVDKLKVYPNPASDFIHIDSPSFYILRWKILDAAGRIVLQNDQVNSIFNHEKIDISSLPAGVYSIEIQNEKEKIVKSIVKR